MKVFNYKGLLIMNSEVINYKEVGSGGPRALRKVLKRALVRVDPLKKVLLRVSALLRVLK